MRQATRKTLAARQSQQARVDILSVAITDKMGIESLNIAKRGRSANYLQCSSGSSQAGGIRTTQTVITVTLDWLLKFYPAPTVLKIDVEGAENQVLAGASFILKNIKPIILCEVSSVNIENVGACLTGHNYFMYNSELATDNRKRLSSPAWSTLAVPGELKPNSKMA